MSCDKRAIALPCLTVEEGNITNKAKHKQLRCAHYLFFYQHSTSSLPGVENLVSRQSYGSTIVWYVAGTTLMCKSATDLTA